MGTPLTMDFFAHQDKARRKTAWLVFLLVLAVVSIICSVYLVAWFVLQRGGDSNGMLDSDLFLGVGVIVLIIISIGYLSKVGALSAGGSAVATMLGGRLIAYPAPDLATKRALNVVEEMALAAGIRVPPVYLLENEAGINAFAAGTDPNNAVIGITRGCMELLNRDELQGVIGHEFSHILNGDMRLNLRLLCLLNGLLFMTIIGRIFLRIRGGKRNALPLIGLALFVLGYVGVFFSALIKNAVSRQREFLADASAVQFTRNPDGIAGALKKIGGLAQGSKLENAHAEEVSHFLFSDGLTGGLSLNMATHPPLKARILRIDPSFDGAFIQPARITPARLEAENKTREVGEPELDQPFPDDMFEVTPENLLSSIGALEPQKLNFAAQLLASLPPDLSQAARSADQCRAVVYLLLLSQDQDIRQDQLESLKQQADRDELREINRLEPLWKAIKPEHRLPLLELSLLSLKSITADQYEAFRGRLGSLIMADSKIDLFERTLQRNITRHLDPVFRKATKEKVTQNLKPLLSSMEVVLSCLARRGNPDEQKAISAFKAGVSKLQDGKSLALQTITPDDLPRFTQALDKLALASPQIKDKVISSMVACALYDNSITTREMELLRTVADALDCPVPPLVLSAVHQKA